MAITKAKRRFIDTYMIRSGDSLMLSRKIIAAIERGAIPSVMASPPTASMTTADNVSEITGNTVFNPSIKLDDIRLRKTGPIAKIRADIDAGMGGVNTVGWIPAWCSFAGGIYSGGNGWEIEFTATGLSSFDIACSGWAAGSYGLRILVDDQLIGAADIVPTFGGSEWARYLKIVFSGAATRRIRIIGTKNAAIGGINVNAGAVVSAPNISALESKMVVFSDSFGDTGGVFMSAIGTFAARLALLMGQRFYPMGRSGQGYALAVDSRTINQRIPLDGPRIDVPDLVLLHGTVNDNAQTAATLQTNMADAVRQSQILWNKAWIVVLSSFSSTSAPIDSTRNAAYYNGAMSVADDKTIVIDTTTLPLEIAISTGTLPDGNAHDSPDNVHWGPNEIAYNVGIIRKEIYARIRKKLTIFGLPSGFTNGVVFSWTPSILNAFGAVTFALSGASLPAGLSFNTATGAITGTPTATGTTSGFIITATDATGNTSVIGPFRIVVAAGAVLSPYDTVSAAAGVTFSESNRRITNTAGNLGARTTLFKNAGTLHSEVTIVAGGAGTIGVGNASVTLNNWMSLNANGLALDSSGAVYTNGGVQTSPALGAFAAGDVAMIEENYTTRKITFGKNGTWSAVTYNMPSGDLAIASQPNNGSHRVATETSQFTYGPRAGATARN